MQRYQEGLKTKMKGSSYIFDHVNLLEYHFHKISLNRGSSYIPSPDWLYNKKATINPINDKENDVYCYMCAITVALNYQNIDNNPQRIPNILPHIPKFNWKDIEFPAEHKDYSAFEKNNNDITLNILYIPHNMEEIRQSYISKHNKT